MNAHFVCALRRAVMLCAIVALAATFSAAGAQTPSKLSPAEISAANNLIQVYQFGITPETMKDYEFSYVGREPVDELNTYVFDVQPRVKLPDPDKSNARYLRGRVWIDEQDMCVVKVEGRVLPEQSGHQASKFETYYQNVD